MNKQLASLLLLAFLPLLPGCFFSRSVQNRPLVADDFAQLVPGRSTDDVVALLGAPTEVISSAAARPTASTTPRSKPLSGSS